MFDPLVPLVYILGEILKLELLLMAVPLVFECVYEFLMSRLAPLKRIHLAIKWKCSNFVVLGLLIGLLCYVLLQISFQVYTVAAEDESFSFTSVQLKLFKEWIEILFDLV